MRKVIIFSITLLLLILLFFYSTLRLRPIAFIQAEANAKNIALGVISDSVLKTIEEKQIEYSNLIDVQRDGEGKVTSISARVENVNIFKSVISKKILENMEENSKKEFDIPLGNLSKSVFLSGRGPNVRVRIVEVTFLESDIESSFVEAGINQTRHTLDLKIKMKMQIVLLLKSYSFEISDSITVADTVIVGAIPDSYTVVNKADNDLIGDIVDFKS